MNVCWACPNTKLNFSCFVHHCVCWPQQNMLDHLLSKWQACGQPVVTTRTIWMHWKKVRGLFSPTCCLVFSRYPPLPTHLPDLIAYTWSTSLCVCVCVLKRGHHKWWPLLTRRPPSSCRADLLLNSLVTSSQTHTHTNAFYYTFHSCTNATGHLKLSCVFLAVDSWARCDLLLSGQN